MNLFKKILIYFKYIKFNKSQFKKKNYNNNNIVLVEFNSFTGYHITVSYIINILADKYKAKIKAYPEIIFHQLIENKINFFKNFLFFLGSKLKLKNFGIFSSFGTSSFINLSVDNHCRVSSEKIVKKYFKKIKTKENLQNFRLNNILIGDLIYDSYLKYYKKKTVDIHDESFLYFFQKSIEYYLLWVNFFKTHNIKAVVAPQSTYMAALPLRIAANLDIKSLVCDVERLYSLKKNRIRSHKEYADFYKIIKEKDVMKNIARGRKEAKKRLDLRFSGKVGVDISYLGKSPYVKKEVKKNFILKQNNKIKILVAPHSFFDAPHALGNHLFADYFEWLVYIFELSQKTDYDWYIKCHPQFHQNTDPTASIVKFLCKKYKSIKYLQPSVSHNKLISEKIDYVLTCNGTIALEYPYLGVSAINASINSPVFSFKSNYNPQSKKKLNQIIMNLKKINKKKIFKNEILNFYFLKNIYFSNNWFFVNYNDLIRYCASHRDVLRSFKAYEFFLKNYDPIFFANKKKSIKRFIESKDYMYNFKHEGISLKEHMLMQEKLY